jgi:hypothetical protein
MASIRDSRGNHNVPVFLLSTVLPLEFEQKRLTLNDASNRSDGVPRDEFLRFPSPYGDRGANSHTCSSDR